MLWLSNANLHIVSKDGDYSSLLNTGRPHPFLDKESKEKKNAELYIYGDLRTFVDKYIASVEEAAQAQAVGSAAAQPAAVADELAPVAGNAAATQVQSAPDAGGIVASPNPEKDAAIESLVHSSNFAETHLSVVQLQPLRATLNKSDVQRLLEAAIDNSQIRWIASDDDVYAFFSALLSPRRSQRIDLATQRPTEISMKPVSTKSSLVPRQSRH